jgi:hypothetical protein
MRCLIKACLMLAAAAAFGVVFSPLLTVTLHDALFDFLDEETAKKVTDYFRRTEVPRAIGITLVLVLWTGIVIAVDRIVGLVRPTPSSSGRP